MHRRALLVLLCVTSSAALVTPSARADEAAAVGKITHLLNRKAVDAYQHLEFEAAVQILTDALESIRARRPDAAPDSGANVHDALGIVTLGGFKQRDQAVKYFRKALQIQPEVRLSSGLANPEYPGRVR